MQQTSLLAYRTEIQPELGSPRGKDMGPRQAAVYQILEQKGPCTNSEILAYLGDGWHINTVVPRTYELVKKGLVKEVERRVCRITGRRAIVWGIVS